MAARLPAGPRSHHMPSPAGGKWRVARGRVAGAGAGASVGGCFGFALSESERGGGGSHPASKLIIDTNTATGDYNHSGDYYY